MQGSVSGESAQRYANAPEFVSSLLADCATSRFRSFNKKAPNPPMRRSALSD